MSFLRCIFGSLFHACFGLFHVCFTSHHLVVCDASLYRPGRQSVMYICSVYCGNCQHPSFVVMWSCGGASGVCHMGLSYTSVLFLSCRNVVVFCSLLPYLTGSTESVNGRSCGVTMYLHSPLSSLAVHSAYLANTHVQQSSS